MSEMIRVLLVEPHKHPRLVEVEHTLENLQRLVGGYIAASYPWDDHVSLVYDDDGKFKEGTCPGCIESDGDVPEWKESGGCPIHKCARRHGVQFCGLCAEFPCEWLKNK